jgi:diketogulonate reductase-like aldo/keto reductase
MDEVIFMSEITEVELKSGKSMPILGFGTWNLGGKEARQSVRKALELGYNHIDTAEGYHNEEEVGKVLEDYDREDLFLTSKVLPSNLHYEDVLRSCEASLEKLGTSYLDLYLVHWPNPTISIRETIAAFEKLHEQGKVKSIGVSNFSYYQLRIFQKISELPVSVNQVEFHPLYHDEELLEYCRENGIQLTASAPLARTKVLEEDPVRELANKYDKTPAQIVLRWEVGKGVVTIPKSSTLEHIEENLEIFDFDLAPEEVKSLEDLPQEERVYMIDLEDETYGIPS